MLLLLLLPPLLLLLLPCSFSVSSREIISSQFSDSSSSRFLPEPRSVSIFETFSIDLRYDKRSNPQSPRHFI
jgi:hypothetical protein